MCLCLDLRLGVRKGLTERDEDDDCDFVLGAQRFTGGGDTLNEGKGGNKRCVVCGNVLIHDGGGRASWQAPPQTAACGVLGTRLCPWAI